MANGKPQKMEISVESLQNFYNEGVSLKEKLDAQSANQLAIRKNTEASLKEDSGLKEHAENITQFIEQALLNQDDERIYVLMEDVLEEALTTVKEHAKNYLEMHASTEAKETKALIEKLRTDFNKAKELHASVQVMLDHMGWDHSEVPEFPTLSRGGRPAGHGGGSGTKGVKEFDYHFTRDGEKQQYDNVSRALWYSSIKSNGNAKDGRLTSAEFKKLLKEQTGLDDEWSQSWEVKLPNGKKLGYVRTERAVTETTDTPEAESQEGEAKAS